MLKWIQVKWKNAINNFQKYFTLINNSNYHIAKRFLENVIVTEMKKKKKKY